MVVGLCLYFLNVEVSIFLALSHFSFHHGTVLFFFFGGKEDFGIDWFAILLIVFIMFVYSSCGLIESFVGLHSFASFW